MANDDLIVPIPPEETALYWRVRHGLAKARAEKREKILVQALKFYADDMNHVIQVSYSVVEADEGGMAKSALAQYVTI